MLKRHIFRIPDGWGKNVLIGANHGIKNKDHVASVRAGAVAA